MITLILSLALWATPDAQVQLALSLSKSGLYEESERLLEGVHSSGQLCTFVHMMNNYVLNDKEKASKYASDFEDSFDKSLPLRYERVGWMMAQEIKGWKSDDMADISRDMKHVASRLEVAKAGQKTQDVQKTVIEKLDKLIKDEEDQRQAKNKKDQQGDAQGKMPMPADGQGNPADDSKIMGGSGKGVVDEKKLRQYQENWGTLPPAKRQAVINEITRDLPPKYKPMIEEYFKALNRTNPKP